MTFGDELLFPKDFVCAEELDGKDMNLTIESINKEELQVKRGPKKKKPVLTFKEKNPKNDNKPYKLVLNVTNANSICVMHGNKAELWTGKRITIFPTQTQFGSETVACVRVREKATVDNQAPAQIPLVPGTRIREGWFIDMAKHKTVAELQAQGDRFLGAKGGDGKPFPWTEHEKSVFGMAFDKRMAELTAPPAAETPREPGIDDAPPDEGSV